MSARRGGILAGMRERARMHVLAVPMVAALLATASAPARADSNTTAFSLDALDARAFALGGTLPLFAKDASAMRWNPSLMVFGGRASAVAGFSQPAQGLGATHEGAALCLPMGARLEDAAPGLAVRRSAVGFLAMGTGFDLSEGARWSETQLGVGYAYALNPYVSAGAVARYLGNTTDVPEAKVSGYAVDLALSLLLSPRMEVAAVVHDAVGRVRWQDLNVSESPPNVVDLAAAVAGDRLRGEMGLEVSSAQATRASFGLEYGSMEGVLQLRAGTRFLLGPEARAVLTAGAGLRLGSLRLDVGTALDRSDALGTTSAASLGYRF